MCVYAYEEEGEGKNKTRAGLLMEEDGQIFKGGRRGKLSEKHWQECKRQDRANVGSNEEEEKERGG